VILGLDIKRIDSQIMTALAYILLVIFIHR
jgi:hypothetical protein